MKRLWAVILIVATLAGCRSSQPTTNPFMQTTVPPPGTTPGMMVMPGEAYPSAASPPVVTTPAPVTPAAPLVPGQGPPLITAPPPLGPEQRFHPPGGSYLYHQSSNDGPSAGAIPGVQLAQATEPLTAAAGVSNEVRFVASSSASSPIDRDPSATLTTTASDAPGTLRMSATATSAPPVGPAQAQPLAAGHTKWRSAVRMVGVAQADTPASAASLSVGETASGARFVGTATSAAEPAAAAASAPATLRIAADAAGPQPLPLQMAAGTSGTSTARFVAAPDAAP